MQTIVAIGGGEITGRETEAIDRHALKLTGAERPNALFLPTASGNAQGYIDTFHDYFGNHLGCETSVLALTESISSDEVRDKINDADLIYVGGGRTSKLLEVWQAHNVMDVIREAKKRKPNQVLAGLSAGAICWFNRFTTDSESDTTGTGLVLMDGLAAVDGDFVASPHHIREQEAREAALTDTLRKLGSEVIGLAIDDCAAYVVPNGDGLNGYSVTSMPDRHVRLWRYRDGEYTKTVVPSLEQ